MRCLVTGAAGFIGHHLALRLKHHGHWVRGVDLTYDHRLVSRLDEFWTKDLRHRCACRDAVAGVAWVFDLAANMGGMGWIVGRDAEIVTDNTLVNTHLLSEAAAAGCQRYLFTSSACVYPEELQTEESVEPLAERDAYPANPDTGYGWQKLLHERLCGYYHTAGLIQTRVARLHNVYGPGGTWRGGREKAPAALCRKVAEWRLGLTDVVEIWGDGEQTRSFLYIDDCVDALLELMMLDSSQPFNIGSDRLVSINQLCDLIGAAAGGGEVPKRYVPGPQGVRGRNADLTLVRKRLGWEPCVTLEEGLRRNYEWVACQVAKSQPKAVPA